MPKVRIRPSPGTPRCVDKKRHGSFPSRVSFFAAASVGYGTIMRTGTYDDEPAGLIVTEPVVRSNSMHSALMLAC